MKCWNCGAQQTELQEGKLPFRATCEKCHVWLHCCKNCKYYAPGLPNSCRVPGTEPISDREKANFCDEFSPLEKHGDTKPDDDFKARFDALFDD